MTTWQRPQAEKPEREVREKVKKAQQKSPSNNHQNNGSMSDKMHNKTGGLNGVWQASGQSHSFSWLMSDNIGLEVQFI